MPAHEHGTTRAIAPIAIFFWLKPKTVERKPKFSELKPKKLTAIKAPISLDVRTTAPALCFRDMTSERAHRTKPQTLELKTSKLP